MSSGLIDNLTMAYEDGTNKMSSVTDNAPLGFKQFGFNQLAGNGASVNSYDGSGNLIYDHTKRATIAYNYLNLPSTITFGSGNIIEHLYDASGKKLTTTRKTNTSTIAEIQHYLDGVEYKQQIGTTNYRLEAIYTPEGRIYNTNITKLATSTIALRHQYSIKDHLGNTRLTFADINGNGQVDVPSEILQENHYYPFGMNMDGPWLNDATSKDNPYQYNSKELESFGGLGWNDYGARWYDGSVGRWTTVDPLGDAPEQVDKSPFSYGWNNPIKYDDPDGRCPQCFVGFAIGFGLDVASQMIFEGKSLGKVNYKTAIVSGITGAVSGGISSVAKLGKATQIGVNAALDASESFGKQVVSGNDISYGQVASDVIMGGVGGQVKVFDHANIKVKENTLNRAERIVANRVESGKSVSSGRTQNVKDAQSTINSANRINDVAGTATGNTLQTASDNVRSYLNTGKGSNTFILPQVQMAQDNTRVVILIKNPKLK